MRVEALPPAARGRKISVRRVTHTKSAATLAGVLLFSQEGMNKIAGAGAPAKTAACIALAVLCWPLGGWTKLRCHGAPPSPLHLGCCRYCRPSITLADTILSPTCKQGRVRGRSWGEGEPTLGRGGRAAGRPCNRRPACWAPAKPSAQQLSPYQRRARISLSSSYHHPQAHRAASCEGKKTMKPAHLHLLEQLRALSDVAKHCVPPVQQVGPRGSQLRLLAAAQQAAAAEGQAG